uniref:Uncharacterized protein n=1 Tax=Arundo donax TaxID=35708 RepID=A0A0A9A071_ARUDO
MYQISILSSYILGQILNARNTYILGRREYVGRMIFLCIFIIWYFRC